MNERKQSKDFSKKCIEILANNKMRYMLYYTRTNTNIVQSIPILTTFSRSWATQLFIGLLIYKSGFFSASHVIKLFIVSTVCRSSFLSRYLTREKKNKTKDFWKKKINCTSHPIKSHEKRVRKIRRAWNTQNTTEFNVGKSRNYPQNRCRTILEFILKALFGCTFQPSLCF